MARRAEDLNPHPGILLVAEDDEVTVEALNAWLDELDEGEIVETKTSAADELRSIRVDGDL